MHLHSAILLALTLLAAPASSQTPTPPVATEPAVTVPIFPNSTCPIMGKKVSTKLFIDIEYGRIYICCKGCDKKILRAPELAYKTAFPAIEKLENTVCPISGLPIGEAAVTVSLQGVEFRVASKAHAAAAIANAQIVLNKLKDPTLSDVDNRTCPITGEPVKANAFVIIGKHIVRLSSPDHLAAVEKAPTATLAKARSIAQADALATKAAADRAAAEKAKDAERKQ